ncbi:four-carbon acid sugar kinase family protein [Breoghania sp.]|uniref:four-carbon acid sugar kinase family protein n=1 Tax=Breoghania sp. TaxID=2065378 RepID=UPI00261B83CE|nr:four-carbon acid sugar kinase family protein [Breoghania sp.]MDJ0930332.1 four-carbon acid sugar kinase family protein [Breoghania sp.]
MTQVLIIADDLAGALDSSVAFAERGLRVIVALDPGHLAGALAQGADVVALSTGSRELSDEDAAAAVGWACEVVGRFDGILMKKVDSRLKGPVAAKVDALSVSVPRPVLPAPAIPRLGRFVIDGAVTGVGVETPIDVSEILNRPVAIPDIRRDEDFDEILPDDLAGTLFIGAVGLAHALARRLVPARGDDPARAPLAIAAPVLVAVGSRDPITLRQIAALDMDVLVCAPNGAGPDVQRGDLLVVQMVEGAQKVAARDAENRFSSGVGALVERLAPATLFACGGETAAAILRRLNVGLLELKGEVLPSLPVSRALDGPVRVDGGLDVVTKSGGFGEPDTLVRLLSAVADRDL